MTKAKQKVRNAGCASCDNFGVVNANYGGGLYPLLRRCEKVLDEETVYDPEDGEIQRCRGVDYKEANKNGNCPHFSDEKKRAAIEREKIAGVVRDEMSRASQASDIGGAIEDVLTSGTLRRIDRIEKRLKLDVVVSMFTGLAILALYVLALT